jgi:hypothetical protein
MLVEPSAGVIELPHLKRLYLQQIVLNQEFVEKLFCGCRVLESLHLCGCVLNLTTLSSQSLKYLNVESCCQSIVGALELFFREK